MNFILYELSTMMVLMNLLGNDGNKSKYAFKTESSFSEDSGKKKRILVVVGGLLGLIILLWVGASLLGRASSAQFDRLGSIAAQQQEISRIAAIGAGKSNSLAVRARAQTISSSLISSQNDIKQLFKSARRKLDPKLLASKKDTATDKALDSAAQSGRFDEAFTDEINDQLKKYQQSVESALANASSGSKQKTVLDDLKQDALRF